MIAVLARSFRRNLATRLALSLVAQLVVVSAVFLGGFVALYRANLETERRQAAEKVGLLLQASLENAMLKRDIDGLRDIVDRLGALDDIVSVMILAPSGEVRFASRRERLGRRFEPVERALCPDCRISIAADGADRRSDAAFMSDDGREILRSVKAVSNREPCRVCHGPTSDHPVNGILVVDHAADGLRGDALRTAGLFAGSGAIVLTILVLATWLMLRNRVTRPVETLVSVSRRLAAGDLEARAEPRGEDEIAALARAFDAMADRLAGTLGDLQEREDFLQAVLDAVPDGIRVIDRDFRVVRANRAFCAQAGLSPTDVIGRPCHQVSHGRDEPCVSTLVTCPVVQLRASGESVKFHDRHVRGEGEDIAVEVAAAALTLADREGARLVVVEAIRDLEALAQVSHEQKLSEIDHLATGVAHEIRNPLSSIGLGLRAALGDLELGDTGEALATLKLIEPEIERCLGITSSLLKLSTPSSERVDLVVLDAAIREVLSLMVYEAESDGVAIVLRLEPDLRVIAPDSEMRMVMINLAQNALHAMPHGGQLRIDAFREAGSIVVEVNDDGVGIRPEDIDRIFLPFWSRRADGVRGTGLGLAICRTILRRAGGTLTVASTVGRGSRFTMRLPDADHRNAS
jgi:PAS domain S-box-containing protein